MTMVLKVSLLPVSFEEEVEAWDSNPVYLRAASEKTPFVEANAPFECFCFSLQSLYDNID